jgi:hypothetical protein
MAIITVSDKDFNQNNLYYVQNAVQEILNTTQSRYQIKRLGSRAVLTIDCPEEYSEIISAEVADKLADVVAINYKYEFFKKNVSVSGLSNTEYEILMASLIAADLDEDKRYSFEKIKGSIDVAVDGIYNFRLQPLKKKWADVVSYIPTGFMCTQLKEFISYLLENKRKRIYIEEGRVYDCHYRRLKKCSLLGGDKVSILREVLLSNCGEIELSGSLPDDDEKYLKEYYGDRIVFSQGN